MSEQVPEEELDLIDELVGWGDDDEEFYGGVSYLEGEMSDDEEEFRTYLKDCE